MIWMKQEADFIEGILDIYRDEVEFLSNDRLLHNDIEKSILFLQNLAIDEELM